MEVAIILVILLITVAAARRLSPRPDHRRGESLLNDTGAIIFVRVATAAAVGQGVSVWGAAVSLPLTAIGGIAIGLAVGWVIAWIRQRLNDTRSRSCCRS